MKALLMLAPILAVGVAWGQEGEWTGELALEGRLFTEQASAPRQHSHNLSFALQLQYHRSWDDGNQSFTFVPFLRWDQHDPRRSHGDIRELTWLLVRRDWELRLGVRKVFWGVAESRHLVDIINQTDLVEDVDGEDKLGQPMINLALIRDWGTLDLFLLPGFRERTYPGPQGRLRPVPPVAVDRAVYPSDREWRHVDVALRWSHYFGDWDVALSHFYGIGREPRLVPEWGDRGLELVPHYDLIHQSGLELQATLGAWLWKLEAVHRVGKDTHNAAVGGFEYTFYGVGDSRLDLGLLGEYLYDDRPADFATPFQGDIMAGLRLSLNDPQSSQGLLSVIFDPEEGGQFFNLEASRRIGQQWLLNLEARAYIRLPADNPAYGLRNDHYLDMELIYYFF